MTLLLFIIMRLVPLCTDFFVSFVLLTFIITFSCRLSYEFYFLYVILEVERTYL